MEYRISDNMKNVKGSAIREIFKIANKPGVISFAGGNPSPLTFPVEEIKDIAVRALTDEPTMCLQYGITDGFEPLKVQVENRLKKQGTYVEGNSVMITTGGQQGAELCAKCFLNSGDGVIVEEPSFIGALNAFRTYGAKLIGVKVEEDGIDINAVEEAIKNNDVKVLYTIPTFQNPTGITMSLEKRKKLLEICEKNNVVIFEDNPYGDLRFKGEDIPTIKSMDKNGCVVYFGSFSKILSPGIRLGFTYASDEIIAKMTVAKQVSDVHTPVLTQYIAAKWMEENDLDAHIKKCCDLYGHQCDLMLSEMDKKFPECVKYTRPEGGIFIWVTLPEEYDANEAVKVCAEKKVAFVPGATFMTDLDKKSNCFRLNYSTMTDEKIIMGIDILAKALKDIL